MASWQAFIPTLPYRLLSFLQGNSPACTGATKATASGWLPTCCWRLPACSATRFCTASVHALGECVPKRLFLMLIAPASFIKYQLPVVFCQSLAALVPRLWVVLMWCRSTAVVLVWHVLCKATISKSGLRHQLNSIQLHIALNIYASLASPWGGGVQNCGLMQLLASRLQKIGSISICT